MLFDELKKQNMVALKEKDTIKRSVLGIAITKCQLVISEKRAKGEELVDGDVFVVLQKLIKEIEEEAEAFKKANRIEKYEELLKQKEILASYLPKLMIEDEIKEEINKLEDKTMPSIMRHFKTNFQGKVDMGLVSKIAREIK